TKSRNRAPDATLDALGPIGYLAATSPPPPLLRAVRVADRHADDRDRRMDAPERDDAGDAAARANDDAAADLLPENPVRRADVVAALGSDRRGLQAESVFADRLCGLVHDAV